MTLFITVLLLLFQSEPFSNFTYCKEKLNALYERQCVELNSAGEGTVRLKKRSSDEIKVNVKLSPSARDRFLGVIAGTNNLANPETYESGRKVADLGKKRLTLKTASDTREAEFNFSIIKEVNDLVTFFEAMTNQEAMVFDIENALQFDRLSIPKWVERIESDLKRNSFADPERLIPLLDKIKADSRVMNYTRDLAGKMKEQILTKKMK
jgi:hypothetical protein